MKRILVTDDDLETCEFLADIFSEEGWQVTACQTAEEARAAVAQSHFDLIVSDINLGSRTNGVALLKEFRQTSPGSEVVLISGFGTLETAVAAVREGAFDYVSKPFDVNQVIATARRALKRVDAEAPAAVLRAGHQPSGLIGHSPKMSSLYKQIALLAPADSTVLIMGESGVGKELVARAIHHNSPRSSGQFITVNCGALTETLLEAEMFGHTKGSFTGAVSDKGGLFELATNARFNGQVKTNLRRRAEGIRIKHWVEENSIKMYDKQACVLRIETTINNARRFKVRRMVTRQGKRLMAWTRMRKGIVDIRRRVEVSRAANERYLEALAVVGDPSPSHRWLDPVSKQVVVDGRTFRPLRPITPEDSEIFHSHLADLCRHTKLNQQVTANGPRPSPQAHQLLIRSWSR